MHAVSHQGKVTSETTTFGWMWSVKLLVKLDCRILWSSISLKKIIWYLSLLYGVSHQGKVAPETIGFGWPWPVMCIWSNWISRFFDHQYLWKKSIYTFVWPLLFCLSFLFISWHLLSNFAGVHLVMTCIYFESQFLRLP